MKYLDEFRRSGVALQLGDLIKKKAGNRSITLMEVCGTHTMSIARYGIRELLPPNIDLISGPGCPVCVTPNHVIDRAIAMSRESDVIITTFGDMMKVPGSSSSLDHDHAHGSDIRVVASTLDALEIALKNPGKKVVFLGVGFETTIPTIAASIKDAKNKCVDNYFVLSAHKLIPPAMNVLSTGKVKINGYICPGHVSTIIGTKPYEPLARTHGIGCVVVGFEPLDILQGIMMLIDQIISNDPKVEIAYSRVVRPEGNPLAQTMIKDVFEPADSTWRGIGTIPISGLNIRDEFQTINAAIHIPVDVEPTREHKGCLCGEVLQGIVKPNECTLFGKMCTPGNPVGPCMVSTEGTCAAYFKYRL